MKNTANLNLSHLRWIPSHLTTPSGKLMHRCACCGRLSATPDKECKSRIPHNGEWADLFCEVWPNHETHTLSKHLILEQINKVLERLSVQGVDVPDNNPEQGDYVPPKGVQTLDPLNLKEFLSNTKLADSKIPNEEAIDVYEKDAMCTANDPLGRFECVLLYAVGLAGEAGEVLEKVKKIWTQKERELDDKDVRDLVSELGDISWYLFQLARILDAPMREILQKNINKRHSRNKRGKLLDGEGDHR